MDRAQEVGSALDVNRGMLLVETKFHAPSRRIVVSRPRLVDRLGGAGLPAVAVVSAPAGFGKTTLLTEWTSSARDAGVTTAWLSLDRSDSDPLTFWTYLFATIRRAVPSIDPIDSALSAGPASLEDLVTLLVNDLSTLADDLIIVLDDYHVVESVEVHESLRFLVEHLPGRVHLVVATRADPPLPLSALRASGRLLEVRAADLRFTEEEAEDYLNDTSGLQLTSADIESLLARTEGWIAALQLASISLRGRDDASGFIASFAGDDRFVVDYLVDDVLGRLTGPVRSFLARTSILSRFTASLCDAVTTASDGEAMLEELERSNLFIVALDDRRQWYRYHQLFRDVLRTRLVADEPEQPAELHRRATAWFKAAGYRAEAVDHAIAAADFDEAAELVELEIPALRRARQDATQREWLDAIPDELFADRPVLNMARVGARMVTGDVTGVELLLDDIECSLGSGDPSPDLVVHDDDGFRRLPAQIAMYRAGLALLGGDLDSAAAHARRCADLCAPADHLDRGAAAALTGLARWADGDLESAATDYSAAITEFEAAEFRADILGCSLGLSDLQVGLGRLSAAVSTLEAGLALAARHGPLRGTADMHLGLAEIHLERNEIDAATHQLDASSNVGEHLALPQYGYRRRVIAARLASIAGDHESARRLIDEARERYDTDYSPRTRPVAATAARLMLAAGDIAGARRWATGAGVAVTDQLSYLHEYEHLTLARVLLTTGRSEEARPLLEHLLAAARDGRRTGSAIEAGLLLAVANHADGRSKQATRLLEGALDDAEPEGYLRLFVDLAPQLAPILQVSGRGTSASPQVAAVSAGIREVPGGRDLVDQLSGRELDVLRLLRTELTGPQIASELYISLNTVRTHTNHIFAKLGVTNRRAAVRRADELGL